MTTLYDVEVTREGGQWLATVRELHGAHTYADNLRALNRRIREVITLMGDYSDDALDDQDIFGVRMDVNFDDQGVTERVDQVRELRRRIEEIQGRLAELTSGVIPELDEEGLSVRDEAEVLGLSHQRVQQLRRDLQDA